ncbi:MAG: hypothetical protein AAF533_20745 [Acidobacteriota bacterium]
MTDIDPADVINDNLLVYPVTGFGTLSIRAAGAPMAFLYTAQNPDDIDIKYGLDNRNPDTPFPRNERIVLRSSGSIHVRYEVKRGTTATMKLGWGRVR